VTPVAVQADPFDSSKTVLLAGGTPGNDSIVFAPLGFQGDILVLINGASQGLFRPTSRIVAFGLGGNDAITVLGAGHLESWLYGGAGNDLLKGAAGPSLLFGGDGDDLLWGGSGRSILVGGRGTDLLIGGRSEDILIGGWTTGDDSFWHGVAGTWKSPAESYTVRVASLRLLLDASSVLDDGAADILIGAGGLDWFLADPGDLVADANSKESVD
jgi:Ca2+-binding RTX toxin-like protein